MQTNAHRYDIRCSSDCSLNANVSKNIPVVCSLKQYSIYYSPCIFSAHTYLLACLLDCDGKKVHIL